MKKLILLLLLSFIFHNTANAQILYNENFSSYNIGNLGNDITGTTPGQGNWYTKNYSPPGSNTVKNENFKIQNEVGRGNYLLIQSTQILETEEAGQSNRFVFKDIGNIWQYKDTLNNILKIEWEFSYSLDKNTYSDRIALGFGVDYDTYTSTAHGFNTGTTYNDEISETYNNHATLLYPALYAN